MSIFKIRIARTKDKAAIERLLATAYPNLMALAYDPEVLAPVLTLITKANPTLLNSGSFYVVESRGGEIIGCGGWTREAPPGIDEAAAGIGHLRHFGTHPDWTRRGVGRAIFERCLAEASAAGIYEFEVLSSLNGEVFYASLGFVRVREVDASIRSARFPCVLMRRNSRSLN